MPAPLKVTDSGRQRLPPPEPGPTAEYFAPVDHVVPRMHTIQDPPPSAKERVWRVTEPELPVLCAWLFPRLRETWPRMADAGVVAELRAAMRGNELLVQTGRVCGLFRAVRTTLEPLYPVVEEVWVRCIDATTKDEQQEVREEASLLYRHAARWAREIGASELVFNCDSDAPMSAVTPDLDRTGKLYDKTTTWRLALK